VSWSASGVRFVIVVSVFGRGIDSVCLAWRGLENPLVAPLRYINGLFLRLRLIAAAKFPALLTVRGPFRIKMVVSLEADATEVL
jgi:hypothetical protein